MARHEGRISSQQCAEKHLHRNLAEFDFKYSNRVRFGVDDVARTEHGVKRAVAKRLTYRTSGLAEAKAL